jgi:hypothetical protein
VELLEHRMEEAALGSRVVEIDERAARRSLRHQIARLERDLAQTFAGAYPRTGLEWGVPAMAGPRMLGLGELERLRDDLADRLRHARGDLARRTAREEECRRLIERMMLDPAAHKHVRVSREDIGEHGCGHWHVRPRLGIVGMLMGWWQVKLSSGCPLAGGRQPPLPSPRPWEDEAASAPPRPAKSGPRAPPTRRRPHAGGAASAPGRRGAASPWSSCACCWRWSSASRAS